MKITKYRFLTQSWWGEISVKFINNRLFDLFTRTYML